MSKRTPRLAPRNGHVAAIRQRPSGAHGKTAKAKRRAEKMTLKREVRDAPESGSAVLPGAPRAMPR